MQKAGWKKAAEINQNNKPHGEFITLDDGENVELVVGEDIEIYKEVWLASENRSELYDPDKHEGLRPRVKFKIECVVRSGPKEYTPSVFDASSMAFDQFSEAIEENGTDTVYKLKRKGTGKDTRYSVVFKRKLEGKEAEVVAAAFSAAPADAEGGDAEDAPVADAPEGWEDVPF